MEDVLSVYQRPYDSRRPQVCVDEIQKTLRSTPRGELPLQPGQPRRQDYEYERHGHCALFLAVEPLAGFRQLWVHKRRTLLDFAVVLRDLVDVVYPDAETIVLVVDNLNIHGPACLYERFAPAEARRIAEKIEWHYTPEHGSWLNIAECELSVLKRQCPSSRLPDLATVQHKATAWQQRRNQLQAAINWRFTTDDARSAGVIRRISEAWYEGGFTLLVPEALLEEILETVSGKPRLSSRFPPDILKEFLAAIQTFAEEVPQITGPIPAVTRDPKDDYLLAYALVGRADYLVSGGKDLLALDEQITELLILSPRRFDEVLSTLRS